VILLKLKINENNYQQRYFIAYLKDNGELETYHQPEEGYTEAEVVKIAYDNILDDITRYGATVDEAFDIMYIVDNIDDNKLNSCTELNNKVHSMVLNRLNQAKADPYDLALNYFDKSYTDKEIKDDLTEKGYSYNFILKVFDYLEDIYENSEINRK